jgi:hypothetical protein
LAAKVCNNNILEDESGNSLKGVAEIILAKHRNGSPQTVLLGFDGPRTLFKNLVTDAPEFEQPKMQTVDFSAMRPKNDDEIPF